MKRAVLAIRNRLVLEAVANALKRAGFFVEKSSSQETEHILTLTNALAATTLVMDVTRSGDGTFDMRMDTVKDVRRQNHAIKAEGRHLPPFNNLFQISKSKQLRTATKGITQFSATATCAG